MSEWIDFAIYALQIALVFAVLSPQSVHFTVPAILDRDPAWPAAHPEVMRSLAASRWFVNTCYAWAAFSIGVLLALRLGADVPVFSAARQAPEWEVLRAWHGALTVIGWLGYFACFGVWLRWLRVNVPLAPERRASLTPRGAGDHVPRWWRVATELLTLGHLAAWLVAPALGFGGDAAGGGACVHRRGDRHLAVVSYYWPQRRQGYADRLFGDAFRRVELRVLYIMRLAPLTTGAVVLGEAILGLDLARAAHLLLALIICGLALAFTRLRPVEPGAGAPTGYRPFAPISGQPPSDSARATRPLRGPSVAK
jgi:hypothetical protein